MRNDPSPRRPDPRREQLVRYAIETLATEGYPNTSLARIAARAGVSKGVISYHFAGKEELIQAVAQTVTTAVAQSVLPGLAAEPRAVDKLRRYVELSIGAMHTHREALLALIEIVLNHRDPDGRRLDARTYEPTVQLLTDLLRQGQLEGDLRDFPPRLMASWLRSMIDSVLLDWTTYGEEVDLDTAARELVVAFHRATRRDPDDR
ncbi:TetR/AcrR family transcriptional regulator [Polymorphospora rubra]|uniref:TetR/AcrR family transcriptional regulator n=1 Tax=Polymorphospora rubra TaxID=338584 RepID=UPI00340AF0C5